RGDRVGFVGTNGAGKTTLLKMLIGQLAPDAGTVRLGAHLEIAALDQKRELYPSETPAHYLTDRRGDSRRGNGPAKHVVSYMKDCLFKPAQARTPVRELSGGERARLVLARILSRPANLLVLDEPTNDLDMETLDLLQELVAGYAGTVLLVSHDRDFLDRTVTSVIAPEGMGAGDGRWIEYAGGYSDMLAQRGGRTLEERAPRRKDDTSPKAKSAPKPPASGPAKKLTYKQKYALETLPGEMDKAHGRIAALETKMADPAFYTRDPAGFAKAAAELDAQREKLAA